MNDKIKIENNKEDGSNSFRLEGKFVGGGWWESHKTFSTEKAARAWYDEQKFTTKSTRLRVVNATNNK